MTAPPPQKKRREKAICVPPDVECKSVVFFVALRSLNFPMFQEKSIAGCNKLIQATMLFSFFKHGEVRDN